MPRLRSLGQFGEALRVVLRRGLLGLAQDLRNRRDSLQPMYLKAGHIHDWHAREGMHRSAIAPEQNRGRLAAGGILAAGFAAGQDNTGRQALHIPLKRPADGFVEVVDVKDQPAIGRGVGAQVAHMRVPAELGKDAGMGQHRQVGGHDRNGAAKKTKGRSRHPLPLDRQQRRHPSYCGDRQRVDGIGLAVGGTPSVLLLTAHLLAPGLPKGAPLQGRKHVLNGHCKQVLHLNIDRIRPAETNHILIAGDHVHIGRLRSPHYIFRG